MTSKSASPVISCYTINIKAANLKVAEVIKSDLIKSRDDLNKTKFDSLIKLLNASITMHFFSPTQSNEITIFKEQPTFLELHLDTIILPRIVLNNPVTA